MFQPEKEEYSSLGMKNTVLIKKKRPCSAAKEKNKIECLLHYFKWLF